jgi:argininosuccinate lyase
MRGKKTARMWGGRFEKAPAEVAEKYSRSLYFDKRLAPYDIAVSKAHARALRKAGILSEKDLRSLLRGLEGLRKLVLSGKADFESAEEDIHSWMENRLREKIGATADRLHAGRSRNDQVVQDLRLYLLDVVEEALERLRRLQEALLDLAGENHRVITAGHTHLQPAQPVLLSHHLMAYVEMFQRDCERLGDLKPRLSILTLGSGALAGTSIPLDRPFLARELGLKRISANSMDAVADRDFAVEFLSCAALCMTHVSRLSEELILWSHPAFGWVEIGEEYCTGSSLMPQKRNPDMPELARGKTGRVTGHLTALLATLKGLPLTYNRDLQEDKEGLFDSADTLLDTLGVMAPLVRSLTFNTERMRETAQAGFSSATDLAEYLARKGVPFRQAHGIVGRLVKWCVSKGQEIGALQIGDLKEFSPLFEKDALQLLSPEASVRSKNLPGGTAPRRVRAAVNRARKKYL